jgi:serine protease AprX
MKKQNLFLCVLIFLVSIAKAQEKLVVVRFKDKINSHFQLSHPREFLSANAITKRTKYHLPINELDLPVNEAYISQVLQLDGIALKSISKWLNQIAINISNDSQLAALYRFPFVDKIIYSNITDFPKKSNKWNVENAISNQLLHSSASSHISRNTSEYNYGLSENQIKIHQADFLHNHGFKGENMKLAILDAGFYRYDALPTFDSVRTNNQIKEVWDFVANDSSVSEDNSHGMKCFSIIAANMPGSFVGSSPNSNFYLYRTEDVGSEMPIEEHNIAVAVERADNIGIDVCSISLGYTTFDDPSLNYTYADMNGNTSISANAVDIAASKGILMVVSAGNEGNSSWQFITTPADADSCLTIGAVDVNGTPAGFSSIGPSSDGDIKPDVASVGVNTIVANNFDGSPTSGSGTSFSCPNMAGIATCLWQAFSEVSNMELISAIRKSASRFENPDDKTGYGIPDAKKAFVILQQKLWEKSVSNNQCVAAFAFKLKSDPSMQIEIERKGNAGFSTINTLQKDSAYDNHLFLFNDDLSALNISEVFYRIKVNIGTDTSYYIDSFSLVLNNPCNENGPSKNFLITPNPFTETINIQLNNTSINQNTTIVIANILGQCVYQSTISSTNNSTSLSLPYLNNGIYFATLFVNGKQVYRQKLLKL